MREQLKKEIIRLYDLYLELLRQHNFNQAGDLYKKITHHTFKKLTEDSEVFKSIVDDLLFYEQKPYVQIEIATEAIGMGYRKEEAIQILEELAIWTTDMTLQNEKGKICNSAQMRLHNLLGYSLDYSNQTCERTREQEITPAFKSYFEARANSSIDLSNKKICFSNKENQQVFLHKIDGIYPDNADCFLFACVTKSEERLYLTISSEGEILNLYSGIVQMEAFKNDRSIFLKHALSEESGAYGVLKRDGDICIPAKYIEVTRLNDFFFIGAHSNTKGDLYHHSGCMIAKDISHYEVIVNCNPTYIYQNVLYDENGHVINELIDVGINWETSTDIGEYVGFDIANKLIYIDALGKILPLDTIDFETQFFLDRKGDVFFTFHDGKSILNMDGKSFTFSGGINSIVNRFSDDYILLRGEFKEGTYLWIDRKKKKFLFFKEVYCTNFGYWFAKEDYDEDASNSYWLLMDCEGKKCISEKYQIINVYQDETNCWIIENQEFEELFFLPVKKKLIKKGNLIRSFIRKNKIK